MSNVFEMARQPTLGELGEGLAGKFAELGRRPCADKCDYLLRDLAEASTAVKRLRTELLHDGTGEAA